jgi:diguanylate cyclase (GGDEF)-like protein
MPDAQPASGTAPPFAWLFELPPHSERAQRMESLIARMRVLILVVNTLLLLFLFDTSEMRMDAVWLLVAASFAYALTVIIVQPYRRWRVLHTSMITALADSLAIVLFIAVTGGAASPFYPLYFVSAAAVAMRFELPQAIAMCCVYAMTYSIVYLASWSPSADASGDLLLRCAYMFFVAVGVGQLAREEFKRAREVEAIERLNAENAKLLSKKERDARIDKLTGLLNRASAEKDAQKEIRKARAAGGYVSILFCDMDGLKSVNDELGHDAGDRVLRAAAQAMRKSLRSSDIIGRYGGDEFVVVLPNLTRESAFDRADALIAAMAGVNEGLPEHVRTGVSVGIATYPFDAEDYPTLVKIADQAMYLAKRAGGNRVRTANDLRLFLEEMPRTA